MMKLTPQNIGSIVETELISIPSVDMHTHLYPPAFQTLWKGGIDCILTYHYLVAEFLRSSRTSPEHFWQRSVEDRANQIWRALFSERTPLSEATRGVLTILQVLGIDGNQPLEEIRNCFKDLHQEGRAHYLKRIMALSNVSEIVMTNDPFDAAEVAYWNQSVTLPSEFKSSLRLDGLLAISRREVVWMDDIFKLPEETSRFIDSCIERMQPLYLAVSLDSEVAVTSASMNMLTRHVFPAAIRWNLPVALMLGVRRGVNPSYGIAGDAAGSTDMKLVEWLCQTYPAIRWLITCLGRENQYELIVLARKFSNLMPFGTWWFLNNRFNFSEITNMRLMLLGQDFIVQHSDARVIEHLIYKWRHTRESLAPILAAAYKGLLVGGRKVTIDQVRNDLRLLLRNNFNNFCQTGS